MKEPKITWDRESLLGWIDAGYSHSQSAQQLGIDKSCVTRYLQNTMDADYLKRYRQTMRRAAGHWLLRAWQGYDIRTYVRDGVVKYLNKQVISLAGGRARRWLKSHFPECKLIVDHDNFRSRLWHIEGEYIFRSIKVSRRLPPYERHYRETIETGDAALAGYIAFMKSHAEELAEDRRFMEELELYEFLSEELAECSQ